MPLPAIQQSRLGEDVIQIAIRLGLLVALIYWCFVLVQPFIAILAWSAVLAVALYPLYAWLSERLGGRPKLAACIITVIATALVIGPVTWLGFGLVEGLRTIYEQADSDMLSVPSPPATIKEWPLVGEKLYDLWNQASTNLGAVLSPLVPRIKPIIRSTLGMAGSVSFGALKFLVSVILVGFLLPTGPRFVAAIRTMMARVLPQRSEELVALAGATIRTVSQGVIGIAVVQSFLIGVGLKFAGFAHAGLIAFLVLVLSIVQIGPSIVLLPCIIWIWMTKDSATALFMTIYLVVVGLADNVLKPLLMGRGLTTPMPVMFIGLLGGTIAHGIVGLFIGPIVLAVGWELMMAWIRDERIHDIPAPAEPVPVKI
jgi:predicted PurR-regulated permease PerM